MKVSLRLFGILRSVVGSRQIELAIDDDRLIVNDLPNILEERYGSEVSKLLSSKEDSFDFLRILINGQDHSILQGMQTEIKDGDVITLLPPLSGGKSRKK